MSENEQLIRAFYTSFQKKDYKRMQEIYSDNAVFNDAVFTNLDARQVKAMWEMLIKRGKDLQLDFKNIQADDQEGSAEWTAAYTFSKTGKKVVNHIKAGFRFKNGKIMQHTDSFDFYKWAKQAFGITGVLLGWTGFFKSKVQRAAMQSLEAYIAKS